MRRDPTWNSVASLRVRCAEGSRAARVENVRLRLNRRRRRKANEDAVRELSNRFRPPLRHRARENRAAGADQAERLPLRGRAYPADELPASVAAAGGPEHQLRGARRTDE